MTRLMAALAAALVTAAVLVASARASSGRSTSTTVSGLDEMSLQTSMQGDLFEIAGGKLALKKSHTRAVDALAKRLIKVGTAHRGQGQWHDV